VPPTDLPFLLDASMFASGSRALAELLAWGVATHGWTRVWLPSYYCPDVPAAVAALVPGLELRTYPDSDLELAPSLASIPAEPGDVVVVANQLGVRPRPVADFGPGITLIEDHSHDPGSNWALGSRADYAFASLRKTLPLPDGGAVWSPRGLALPPEPVLDDVVAQPGLADALRRRAQRPRRPYDEIPFRAFARSAFGRSGVLAPEAISPVSRVLLPHMPMNAWRDARRRNHALLMHGVALPPGCRVLPAPDGGVAFAYTLVFETAEQCVTARASLTQRAVVPTVIWPLDPARHPGTGPADADLSARILSIACDQRYTEADMHHLAAVVREALLPCPSARP
jgi:hypothetical protein